MSRELMVVEGGEALSARLKALSKGIDVDLAEEAMLEAAEPMRAEASGNAPVRTGLLAGDISLAVQAQEPGAATVALRIAKAFYWRFVEFGTRFRPAHPFIRPAYDTQKDATVKRWGERLNREIDAYTEGR